MTSKSVSLAVGGSSSEDDLDEEESPDDDPVEIWQLSQYLQHQVIPLLCLLMVQQHGLLLFDYYCCAIV